MIEDSNLFSWRNMFSEFSISDFNQATSEKYADCKIFGFQT